MPSAAGPCPRRYLSISQLDATAIIPNLYQGGLDSRRDGRPLSGCTIGISDIHTAVVLAPDAEVRVVHPYGTPLIPLEDHVSDLGYAEALWNLAGEVAMRHAQGARVAIFCRLGKNRSGLLCSMVLMKLNRRLSGREAVKLIQHRRRGALTNTAFTQYLKSIPPLGTWA